MNMVQNQSVDLIVVAGTRAEAYKLAPLLQPLKLSCLLLWTSQHRDFPADLPLRWQPLDPLPHPLPRRSMQLLLLEKLLARLQQQPGGAVLVQGDTCSAYIAAMAARMLARPLLHLEAGLRSDDPRSPFPEEIYRRRISRWANLHLAPSARAVARLVAEGVPRELIMQVGSTAVDGLRSEALNRPRPEQSLDLLVEIHRRENAGAPLQRLAEALHQIRIEGLRIAVATHPNGKWQKLWTSAWSRGPTPEWLPPLPRTLWLETARRARLVLSDSGAAAEEMPYLGVPLLVYRQGSERPEAYLSGHAVRLCPTEPAAVLAAQIRQQLARQHWPAAWPLQCSSPYGDGNAGRNSAHAVERFLGRPAPSCRRTS
jgi:UDP-N-acetylglucosamine 2-epimerase (non-hydrolysing)